MNYAPATPAERARMLERIGVASTAELFADLPPDSRETHLDLPSALSEIDVSQVLRDLAERNVDLQGHPCFLGAGAYQHYIPSVVNHVIGRSEFFTSYTPYQPEVSQGTLQTIYEFQSMMCALTGMEIANASMYDGASALAEAAIMAANLTDRGTVLLASSVHPDSWAVVRTYVQGLNMRTIADSVRPEGTLDVIALGRELNEDVACVVVQYPNFFGCVEDLAAIADVVHRAGALLVVVVNPLALGLLAAPGQLGADIVVGEGQPLGIPVSFGGPYLGIFATRERFIRQLPGRIVGATTDTEGNRGFVLTFQTREQHIRREKATSNICSNEALCALASTVYLSYLGKQGLRQVAELCVQKAHYLARQLSLIPGFHLAYSGPFFHEFVVRCPVPPEELNRRLLDEGIIGGYLLGREYPDLADAMLLCTTELNRRKDLDRLLAVFRGAVNSPVVVQKNGQGRTDA
ncbi:MAG TPA: aminomethyl-transferring glycine dehydrogenase subunit GcvPA [Chloroflexota bacterium]|nr:aminomethyl-transferring glycine dehydrogenase subunit GcvPA [Chloroflexota bacterium]